MAVSGSSPFSFAGATCACDVEANKKAAMRALDLQMSTERARQDQLVSDQANLRLTQLQAPVSVFGGGINYNA